MRTSFMCLVVVFVILGSIGGFAQANSLEVGNEKTGSIEVVCGQPSIFDLTPDASQTLAAALQPSGAPETRGSSSDFGLEDASPSYEVTVEPYAGASGAVDPLLHLASRSQAIPESEVLSSAPVPEASTMLLLGLGIFGLVVFARRKSLGNTLS